MDFHDVIDAIEVTAKMTEVRRLHEFQTIYLAGEEKPYRSFRIEREASRVDICHEPDGVRMVINLSLWAWMEKSYWLDNIIHTLANNNYGTVNTTTSANGWICEFTVDQTTLTPEEFFYIVAEHFL